MSAPPVDRRAGGRGEARIVPEARPQSYYGKPILATPVWTPEVPAYFFTGGLAGASAGLAFGADLAGNRRLGRRAWLTSVGAVAASPPLLISDLGVPRRFFNMLRVFKVTSPMSVGSWLLSASGGAIGVAALSNVTGRAPALGRASGAAAAVLGLPLSTYTATLIANTAVPIWHEGGRELPFAFAGSSAASAGAAAALLTPRRDAGPARRLAVAGALLEVAAMQVMERRLGELAEPLEHGEGSKAAKAAKALGVAGSAALALRGRRSRAATAAGAAAVLAASALERWAIFRAGFESSRDPRYTVEPQRRRLAEGAGTAA